MFIVVCPGLAGAYLNPSLRIRALGTDFIGLVPDERTDIFRNPAYLAMLSRGNVSGEFANQVDFWLSGVLPLSRYGVLAYSQTWKVNETSRPNDIFPGRQYDVNLRGQYGLRVAERIHLGVDYTYLWNKTRSSESNPDAVRYRPISQTARFGFSWKVDKGFSVTALVKGEWAKQREKILWFHSPTDIDDRKRQGIYRGFGFENGGELRLKTGWVFRLLFGGNYSEGDSATSVVQQATRTYLSDSLDIYVFRSRVNGTHIVRSGLVGVGMQKEVTASTRVLAGVRFQVMAQRLDFHYTFFDSVSRFRNDTLIFQNGSESKRQFFSKPWSDLLTVPLALETNLSPNVEARFGTVWIHGFDRSQAALTTSLQYTLGLGFHFGDLSIDALASNSLTASLQQWRVSFEYRL